MCVCFYPMWNVSIQCLKRCAPDVSHLRRHAGCVCCKICQVTVRNIFNIETQRKRVLFLKKTHTHWRTSTIYTPILPCRSRHVDSAAFTSSWFFFLSIERTHRPLFHHLPLHCFTVLNYSLNARKFASVGVSVCIRIAEFSDVIKQTFACLKQTNARLFYVRRQNAAFLRFLVFVLCLSLLA